MRWLLPALLVACGPAETEAVLELPEGTLDDAGSADAPEGQLGRERRRMSVQQLADSIEEATGRRWTRNGRDAFADFSPTLGVPDWIERTHEGLTPDLVFNKLLEDAATEVCAELVAEESSGGSRLLVDVDRHSTLATDRDDIERAISTALLRFHGHTIPAGDDRLGGWVWLFDTSVSVTEGDTLTAWTAVCTALIVHPDFYTY
jgi:hypothetical protein